MTSYLLLIVTSATLYLPKSFTITEFSSKESCEIALEVANEFYKTVERDSKCISVAKESEKGALKRLQEKLNKENN